MAYAPALDLTTLFEVILRETTAPVALTGAVFAHAVRRHKQSPLCRGCAKSSGDSPIATSKGQEGVTCESNTKYLNF